MFRVELVTKELNHFYYFSKRKWKYFYTFNHFGSEKSSKRAKLHKSTTMKYDPQSAGINLLSPQSDSTPWTLTLKLTDFDIVFHNSPAVLAISGPLLLGLSFLIWSRFEFIQMKKADWALLGCPSSLIFFCLLSIFSPFLKAWKSASFSAFFWAMIASAPPSSSHDLFSASYRFLSSTAFSSHS